MGQSGGRDFFFFLHFSMTELDVLTKLRKKKLFKKIMKKKFQSALFSPLGQWTGNNFSFKVGLRLL